MVPRTTRRRQRRSEIRRARRQRRLVVLSVLVLLAAVAAIAISVFVVRQNAVADAPDKGRLLLNEGFNGTTLNTDNWSPCYEWSANGCTNQGNHELEWYVPGQVKVADGLLTLEAKPQSITGIDNKRFHYVSGMISGLSPDRTLFSFKYGYVESRVKIPKGQGLWPALWMLPASRASLPEVDIFETVGEAPNVAALHTHWLKNGKNVGSGTNYQGPDFSAGWHTFGLEWKPDSLTWYVDGVARLHVTDPKQIPREQMYLIANLAVGGTFTRRPNQSTPFPAALKIDYIKVWGEPA
jgi:beta-glucanase (GH16 family)